MLDSDTSNKPLEKAAEVIIVPRVEDLDPYATPEDLVNRLNQLEQPWDRVKTLLKNYIDIRSEATHEAKWLREVTITTLLAGGFLGALANSRGVHEDYIRKHNAAVFNNQYVGNRHFYDTLLSGLFPKVVRYGVRSCALVTSVSLLSVSSLTYRGKLYAPDWIVGYTAIGALSRLWLGPRAMAVGGLIGSFASLFSIGVVKCLELGTGFSLSRMRLLNHYSWVEAREAKHQEFILAHQKVYDERFPDSFKLDIDG